MTSAYYFVSLMANNQQPHPLRQEEQSMESFQTEMISRMYSIVEKEMTNQFKAINGKLAAVDTRIVAMENKNGILKGAHWSLQQEFKGIRHDLGTFIQKVDGMEGQIASILRIFQSCEG